MMYNAGEQSSSEQRQSKAVILLYDFRNKRWAESVATSLAPPSHRIGLAHSPDYAFFIFFRKNPRALAELTRSPRLQLSSADAARPCEQHAPRGPRIAAPPARQPRCRTKLPARLPCRSTELRRRAATQPSSTVAKPCSPPSPRCIGLASPRLSAALLPVPSPVACAPRLVWPKVYIFGEISAKFR